MAHRLEKDPSFLRSALLTALGDFCQVADIFAEHEPSSLDVKFFYHTLFFRCYNLKQILAGDAHPIPTWGFVCGVLSELESLITAPLGSGEVQNDHMDQFPGLQSLHHILATLGDSRSRLTTLQKAVAFGGKEKQTALLELLSKGGVEAQAESYDEIIESGLALTRKIRQKPPDNVRSAADSLLTVLKAKGECDCEHTHECVVQLSLETHRAQMSSCQFDLYFGLEELWQEARVISAPKPLGIPVVSIQHHTGNASRGSRKRKRQSGEVDRLCKHITKTFPDHRLKFRLEGDCLWRLPSEETNFMIDKSGAPVSLTQLLVERSILFNDRIKRILSVSLGYAVLHLNETPWLSPIWGSRNVMFFRSSGGFLMRPYIRNELDNVVAAHQVDSNSDDEEFEPERLLLPPCPCLIGLAIVLMEIHKAASFQTLLEVYDIEFIEETDLAIRFTTTRDLFQCCRYDFTDQTRTAISACLDPNIDLDDAGETLDDFGLQSIIYERIVRHLEDELEQGFSDVTVDQLDDLIQTLDLANGGQPPHETKMHRPRSTNIVPRSFKRLDIGRRVQYLSSEMNMTSVTAENIHYTPNMILTTNGGKPPSAQMESVSNTIAPTAAYANNFHSKSNDNHYHDSSIETHRNFVAPLVPSKSPVGRPDTIRVTNIPDDMSRPDLREKLERLFASECKIHSLARASRDARWKKFATVTFPELQNTTLNQTMVKLQRQVLEDHLRLDKSFLDLTPLYDGGDSTNVDIIAIEGLGTNPFGTFRAPQGDLMWLRDFLPQSFPSCRVLLYGYDSRVPGSMSNQSVPEIASTCKNIITDFRELTKTDERPIIWLGQSMGGLIVQEVLVQARQHRSQKTSGNLSDHSIGFLGYGVPMKGLQHESLLNAVRNQPNFGMIQSICLDGNRPSRYLEELANRFALCKESLSTYHFYETNPSQDIWDPEAVPQRKVDDQGVVGHKDSYWVPRNHSELVKVSDTTDSVYVNTVRNIALILNRHLPSVYS